MYKKTGKKVADIITEIIIEKLEAGQIPWRQQWGSSSEWPANIISGKNYRGLNVFTLLSAGYERPYFLTWKQIQEKGGKLKAGAKYMPVVFWKFFNKAAGAADDPENLTAQDRPPILRYYRVYNISQVEGIDFKLPTALKDHQWNPEKRAEEIINNMKNRPILQEVENQAYYRPMADILNMPKRQRFQGPESYYNTFFHELTHSTGHHSRLNRFKDKAAAGYGTQSYSKEELTAEMGSAFLMGYCGLFDKTADNSAAYIKGWLQRLRNDKNFVIQAAGRAQKAADYICPDINDTEYDPEPQKGPEPGTEKHEAPVTVTEPTPPEPAQPEPEKKIKIDKCKICQFTCPVKIENCKNFKSILPVKVNQPPADQELRPETSTEAPEPVQEPEKPAEQAKDTREPENSQPAGPATAQQPKFNREPDSSRDFLSAAQIKVLNKVFPKKSQLKDLPILHSAEVVKAGAVTVTDLDNTLKYYIRPAGADFTIGKENLNILSAEFTTEPGKITGAGISSYIGSVAEFPRIEPAGKDLTAAGEIPEPAEFIEALNTAIRYISTDETRLQLCGINWNIAAGTVTGTNGHILFEKIQKNRPACNIEPDQDHRDIIINDKAARILKAIQPARLFFQVDEKQADFYGTDKAGKDFYFITRIITGPYPNYKKVIPDQQRAKLFLEFNRRALLDELKRFRTYAHKKTRNLKLIIEKNKITGRVYDPDINTEFMQPIPGTVTIKTSALKDIPFTTGCNIDNLKILLESTEAQAVTFNIISEITAIVAQAGAVTLLIMPIRQFNGEGAVIN